jgi:glycosyltransferase involved in cell wall biosynthesis
MKIGVYNRYWSTGGGAEKYGGIVAQVLAGDGQLDLLSHDPVDLDWLSERLHLDLAKVRTREIDDEPGSVTEASKDYDLFVNVSFMSIDRAATRNSLYVVHFPSRPDGQLGGAADVFGRQVERLWPGQPPAQVEWGGGFHPTDPGTRPIAWTNGDASLLVTTQPGKPVSLLFVLGHRRPAQLGPTKVTVEVDGKPTDQMTLASAPSLLRRRLGTLVQVEVVSPDHEVPVEVRLKSDTFRPADVLGVDDRRRLGVPLQALRVARQPLGRMGRWLPLSAAPPVSTKWVESYGAVVSNSEFTRDWVKRWWETDSEVLYPPVSMHERGDKEPVILNVGRFFAAEHGHSKKQLELVKAFRQLCDRRGVKGWTLHLVGGTSDLGESYVEQVRRQAEGYPVELHVNASGDELAELYGKASVYWHASGLGEDANKHPDRLEHFGITTVEAMSAGAVPVVIGLAGQLETVRQGVDGYHFETLDGLCDQTESLIRDDTRRKAMSCAAEERARAFSTEAFEERIRQIVDQLG